jgi:hypothetical protein
VVNRFHLVQNLRQALEAFLVDRRPALQAAAVCKAMRSLQPLPLSLAGRCLGDGAGAPNPRRRSSSRPGTPAGARSMEPAQTLCAEGPQARRPCRATSRLHSRSPACPRGEHPVMGSRRLGGCVRPPISPSRCRPWGTPSCACGRDSASMSRPVGPWSRRVCGVRQPSKASPAHAG